MSFKTFYDHTLAYKSRLDLRAPVLTRLRRGVGVRWLRVLMLVVLDAIALFLAWQIAVNYGTPAYSIWDTKLISIVPIIATPVGLIAAKGLYDSGQKRRDYFSLVKAISFSHILLLLVAFFYQPNSFISRSTFVLSWILSVFFVCLERFTVNVAVCRLRKQGAIRYPAFLICTSDDREEATSLLLKENCYNLLGWKEIGLQEDEQSFIETLEYICHLNVSEVFICSWQSIKSRMFLYWKFRNAGIMLHILPSSLESFSQKLELGMVGGLPLIHISPPLITGIDFLVKRCFDFCCATLFVLLAAPLYLGIALLIKLDSPGPIFYKQTRIGLHGRPFKIWKFRTMVSDAEQLQKKLESSNEMKDGILFKMKNDPRITRVGKILRHFSLDELPQLFNVIWGEMSLIGPRPLPLRDVEKFAAHHFIRHEVLPGISGLWQVSGRSDITDFEEILRLDITYIENWSLSLDWQILLKTIMVILRKSGAY